MALLVSDFDGTLYTDDRNMKINCEYLSDFISKGNHFVLSSGRSYTSLMEQVNKYNIPYTYLSCCDGSFLFDKRGNLICASPVSHDVLDIYKQFKKLKKQKKLEFAYPDKYGTTYNKNELIGSVALTFNKKDIDEDFNILFDKIKNEHQEYQYDIYTYGDEVYYLIRPHGVSKKTPITYLQSDLGIDSDEIYTIGDNTNDRELIRDYNGYRIGSNPDIIDVALQEYSAVHELIDDINKRKVKKR